MRVKEWMDDIVFLHEIAVGTADRSYGIHVGKLAGLPPVVVDRAKAVLKMLEAEQPDSTIQDLSDALPLFQVRPTTGFHAVQPGPSAIESVIDRVIPDEMSPRDALNFIYEIKKIRDDNQTE